MRVYCDAEDCENYHDGECINQFQTGEEAIKIETTFYGLICTDYMEKQKEVEDER